MATRFEILVAGVTESYAHQACAAAFRELDRLEGELSLFIESSDIARANRLAKDEAMVIGADAFQCLLSAAELAAMTGGAFDPAYATARPAGESREAALFALDETTHELISLAPRLHLDLGAVGKGYALDRMAEVLGEWDIRCALLQSGGSTVLALDAPEGVPGWPVGLGEGRAHRQLALARRAMGASGIRVQPAHLIDPRRREPAARQATVWAFAENAARADALSTAFFVLRDDEIGAFCSRHAAVGAALPLGPDGIRFEGLTPPAWP